MEVNSNFVRIIMENVNKIEGVYDLGAKWRGLKANTLYLLYALSDGKIHTQKSLQVEWLFQRTTLNTIIKECESDGYVVLTPIKGKKRELQISLTSRGEEFSKDLLKPIHLAEQRAIERTLQECSSEFITGLTLFTNNLLDSFEESEIHQ